GADAERHRDDDARGGGEVGAQGRPRVRPVGGAGRAPALARGGPRPQAADALRPRGAAAPGVLAADRLPPPRGGPPGPAPRVLGRARTGARLAVALLRRPRPAVRRAVAALDGPAPMDSVAVSAVPAAARERRATRDPA